MDVSGTEKIIGAGTEASTTVGPPPAIETTLLARGANSEVIALAVADSAVAVAPKITQEIVEMAAVASPVMASRVTTPAAVLEDPLEKVGVPADKKIENTLE